MSFTSKLRRPSVSVARDGPSKKKIRVLDEPSDPAEVAGPSKKTVRASDDPSDPAEVAGPSKKTVRALDDPSDPDEVAGPSKKAVRVLNDPSDPIDPAEVAGPSRKTFDERTLVLNLFCVQKFPQLEDESPPWNFYSEDLLDHAVKLAIGYCNKRLVTKGNQTKPPEELNPDASTQTDDNMVPVKSKAKRKVPPCKVPPCQPPPIQLPAEEPPRNPQNIAWRSLMKKTVLAVSLIHSAYALGTVCFRGLGFLNNNVGMANQEATCQVLPATMWQQVASKLCIHGYTN